ncbi:MAG: hypothetical protein WA584_23390 [Pyrinomonadaceae bacterium]
MSFSYDSTLLNLPLNHLRFLVQDTTDKGHFFEDSEITFVAASESNINRAAARLCRTAAAKFAQMPSYEDKLKLDSDNKSKTYSNLAKEYDAKADRDEESLNNSDSESGGMNMPQIRSCTKPTFSRKLHFSS